MADNDFMSGYALGQNEGSKNNGGMFGGGGWEGLLGLIVILALVGNGGWGGGFGGIGGGRGSCGYPCATQADVRAAVDQQTLISKLDNQTYGLADATYAINNAITAGFHGVDRGLCDLSHQISDCCCTTQRAIDGVNYNIAKGFCDLSNVMNANTRDIIDSQNAGTRAVLDFLVQEKLAAKDATIADLRMQISQSNQNAVTAAGRDAQTAELIRRLGRDCPVPAYVVPNPNCCYGNPVGVGYSGNGGCGCGGFTL